MAKQSSKATFGELEDGELFKLNGVKMRKGGRGVAFEGWVGSPSVNHKVESTDSVERVGELSDAEIRKQERGDRRRKTEEARSSESNAAANETDRSNDSPNTGNAANEFSLDTGNATGNASNDNA